MRKAQNPGGDRGRIGKRAMRRAEEQEIETGQRNQFGREQNRDLAPQQRPVKSFAHSVFFLAFVMVPRFPDLTDADSVDRY
jgi:hypothetical protein